MSISSAEDSPVRTSASRARARGSWAKGRGSGSSTPVSFAIFDPSTCSWRTYQLCLFGGWTPFSGRWPRSGTMRNGTAFRLPPLAPRISGTGSSYWGTPTAHERTHSPRAVDHGVQLANQVAAKTWPTPTLNGNHNRKGLSAKSGDGLATSVKASAESSGESIQPTPLNPQWVEWLMGFPIGWTNISAED